MRLNLNHMAIKWNGNLSGERSKQLTWNTAITIIEKGMQYHKLSPHCFTLMNNHFHLLFGCPVKGEESLLKFIKSGFGCLFHVEFYNKQIKNIKEHNYAYKYIYQNPVKAGMCSKVEEYRFNSLSTYQFRKDLRICLEQNKARFLPFHFQLNTGELFFLNRI